MKKINYNTGQKLRTNILKLSNLARSSHIGSCLSIVEILTVLFNNILKNYSVKKNSLGDRFFLSKGHGCLALYCILHEKKFISKKILFSYGQNNSLLMSHVSHDVPSVIFSTGSLGHGLPVAVGSALSAKIKKSNRKTYVLLSDGELNEGTTWEALMFASHHKLNNLCLIVDYNKMQSLTTVSNTLKLEPLKKKIESFGCKAISVNGHNYFQLKKAFKFNERKKPKVIIANTVKGKGISFMENNIAWHYKFPNKRELMQALKEIDSA